MYLEAIIPFGCQHFHPYSLIHIEFGFIVHIDCINQKFTKYDFYYRKAKFWFKL